MARRADGRQRQRLLAWSPPQTVAKGTVAPTVVIGQTGLLAPTSAVNLVFSTPVTGVSQPDPRPQEVGGGHIAGTLVYPSTGPTTATFKPDQALLPRASRSSPGSPAVEST